MDKPKRLAPMKTIHDIELPEKPKGKPKRLAPMKTIYDLGYRDGGQAGVTAPSSESKDPAVASQERVKAPAFVVTVDGSQVATAASMAEALEILPALVRSTPPRPGHTVRIEIRDPHGKPVRLVFLPPWQGVRS
ncbi:hypothetical protein [Kyrpidia tusciae]|uniref:Uncharacterized protein n=1 Tax=Kyrpidia tusciae (strain DSM 2912 / NBRC 15312 / T2) TaxID=562970 RepID=D5WQM8_KYRT2|nr:hypothetical protein [Kyrpidia tusciae]ADG06637.1 hypothetical protein Btus_1942 [Kyrpidia tusciae DSM 2912]